MRAFLGSKKAWGLMLGSICLLAGGYWHVSDAYYIAIGVLFGAHQAAQGAQDHALAQKGG